MRELWQPEDLTGSRPDVDELAFGTPGMVNRWRAELRNAETQSQLTQLELDRAVAAPDVYGPAHLARLEARLACWRIVIADYRRYVGDELGPGTEPRQEVSDPLF